VTGLGNSDRHLVKRRLLRWGAHRADCLNHSAALVPRFVRS
jgi:hypothetical protein